MHSFVTTSPEIPFLKGVYQNIFLGEKKCWECKKRKHLKRADGDRLLTDILGTGLDSDSVPGASPGAPPMHSRVLWVASVSICRIMGTWPLLLLITFYSEHPVILGILNFHLKHFFFFSIRNAFQNLSLQIGQLGKGFTLKMLLSKHCAFPSIIVFFFHLKNKFMFQYNSFIL